jgi:DNA-binding NtrC family response regulator
MFKILLSLKRQSQVVMPLIHSYKVDTLREYESLLEVISRKDYDLILLEDDIDMISQIKSIDPRAEIILFGNRGEDIFEFIRQGAYAYFSFPVEIEKLKETIESVADMVALRQENAKLERQLSANYTFFDGVVGRNPQMLDIFTLLKRIAPYYKMVTIMGETGTGKEIVAKALHSISPAATEPFVICDCGAIVENLLESELFGHKKGSFTGAVAERAGLFETAREGVLFLDEVDELSLSSQSSLLRVLQSGEFRRVGDDRLLKAKCKVIAATNKDLQVEVRNRRFREDLFYRITPLKIYMPPLRERKDDMPILARYFLERFSNGTGKRVLGISRPAQIALLSYNWPGNVRELENVLEQAAILTGESFIRLDDLPENIRKTAHEVSHSDLLSDVVKKHIEEVLMKCGGNRSKASKLLGMSRRSLLRAIDKYGIKVPAERTYTKNAHL